ncbi:hypothetical protein Dfer_5210 [Dyadobacter fermentans DSM 18053]|uniref:Uncharacterized protein n=1 Tax=Dyadobacter fermentans (strain ATCC 700827 / DSM 18053 / CIP 107007 / KCTC 52180 / NS114) TaxID=471854 RepID=C6VSH3_DYAFD|nr:hypothetical protein Dfer_5210 [Dyadobacter fermentans DSM 18053]
MSKRLIRIKPADIQGKIDVLLKHPLNIVVANGNTIFGRLLSADATQLIVKDTRDHRHEIAVGELYELVYDDNSGVVPPSRHATL